MILAKFLLATAAMLLIFTVLAWVADRGEPAYPPCDVTGCDQQATRRILDLVNVRPLDVCWRCADELTARDGYQEVTR